MKYIASTELESALDVAKFLRRPLLLSGEPGTGKTTFADYVQSTYGYSVYKFYTKSISVSSELFYYYDAVSHFANKEMPIINFIKLQPLGIAIINGMGKEAAKKLLHDRLANDMAFANRSFLKQGQAGQEPEMEKLIDHFLRDCDYKKSLVLIDEIDKAPRDFPNDILNEIENYAFEIKELGLGFAIDKEKAGADFEILVILTSNFEKNLPDAFLRRCIYHHIKFPATEALEQIVKEHLDTNIDSGQLTKRIDEFMTIRRSNVQKKPATSELIDCIKYLVSKGDLDKPLSTKSAAIATLLKKRDDIEAVPL
jgi:MoxR-like ATPase